MIANAAVPMPHAIADALPTLMPRCPSERASVKTITPSAHAMSIPTINARLLATVR